MRPTFRKLEVKDIGDLEKLVAENMEGVEPGLKVVDSRLLLGQAAIDLVGLDSRGSLALIALDFTADEGLLLRVMDAYSWCLEFPDTLRRLYPMAQISTSRPPRILFIAERLTDSFLRRIKQLSFLEIDCLEFRHLEVNGESVVFFDHVERLRKAAAESPVEAPAPTPVVRSAARVTKPRVEPVKSEVVRPSVTEVVRPPVVEVARPQVAEAVRTPVAEMVHGEVVQAEVVDAALPDAEIQAPSAPAFVAPPAAPVIPEQPASQEYQSVRLVPEPAPAVSVPPALVSPEVAAPAPVKPAPALQLEPIQATASLAVADTGSNGHVAEAAPSAVTVTPMEAPASVAAIQAAELVSAPVAAAVPVSEPAPEALTPAEPPAPAAVPVQTPPVWAKAQAQANGNRPYFFAQATKSPSPVEAPAPAVAAAPVAVSSAPAQPSPTKAALAVDDRPELESLSFPKDGLSRQWLEFLSQLGATK